MYYLCHIRENQMSMNYWVCGGPRNCFIPWTSQTSQPALPVMQEDIQIAKSRKYLQFFRPSAILFAFEFDTIWEILPFCSVDKVPTNKPTYKHQLQRSCLTYACYLFLSSHKDNLDRKHIWKMIIFVVKWMDFLAWTIPDRVLKGTVLAEGGNSHCS